MSDCLVTVDSETHKGEWLRMESCPVPPCGAVMGEDYECFANHLAAEHDPNDFGLSSDGRRVATDGGQVEDGTERTCEVHHCAADPCVLHREDGATTYLKQTFPIDEPTCGSCGGAMSKRAMAGGGYLNCWRHKFECPDCDAVVVVEAREAQRQLSAFAGGGSA